MKNSILPDELCAKMPAEFGQVFKRVRKLDFTDEPDYDGYIANFVKILTDRGIDMNNFQSAYDWNRSHKKRPK